MGRTLYDKLWDSHVVAQEGEQTLLYVDRHLLHEVSTPQAFAALRADGLRVRRPATQLAVVDHSIPTSNRSDGIKDPQAAAQVALLESNCAEFGIEFLGMESPGQGIVHVIGPEQGFTLPGMTVGCGDSHTSTHGAFGALAFGIGASECGTIMATQALWQKRAKTMRVSFPGQLAKGVSAKDMALALIGQIGASGAVGYAVEFAGEAVEQLSMEGRMTLCNMAIEAGSRTGLVAPDATTFAYLEGRARVPQGAQWDAALAYWHTLYSDPDVVFDAEVVIPAESIAPQVTFGTSPDQVIAVDGRIPADADGRLTRALGYMGLGAGGEMADLAIDHVFIGSCTNGRIEDLRAAAAMVQGRKVHGGVTALVVPGSVVVKAQAEAEGLDRVFLDAGFEWREPGCSLCVAMNDDRLSPGSRCASTSNRNFEGRQGPDARTHLMSPAMAAAAAIAGRIVDIREWPQ